MSEENNTQSKFHFIVEKKKYLIIFAVCILIICLGVCGWWNHSQKKVDSIDNIAVEQSNTDSIAISANDITVSDNTVSTEEEPINTTEPLEEVVEDDALLRRIDFTGLKENENADIYAWIYIPDTNVDYPILQHPKNNTYYLQHNIDGSKGYPGCIYTEKENSKDFSDYHTLIYGHNMRNGSMFHDLRYYEDKEYLSEHPYIYIYTEDEIYKYQIFASYKYTDAHLLHAFQYNTEKQKQQYIKEIAKYYKWDEEIEITADSHLITLSTCVSGQDNKRWLVQGVLVE